MSNVNLCSENANLPEGNRLTPFSEGSLVWTLPQESEWVESQRSQTLPAREARLRRYAQTRGYFLTKLRPHDPSIQTLGRYVLVDPSNSNIAWADDSISEVRAWLKCQPRQ